MAKKQGLISRLIEGPVRSETYAASTLPKNRWELGWDVFKTNFWKLVGLNLLTLLFCLPFIFLLVLRYLNKFSIIYTQPLAQNLSGGYPLYPNPVGLEQFIEISVNQQFFMFLLIAVAIAAVGLSGGFYVMRNLVWTESVMVGSDFFRGVKQNFFVVFFSLLFYSVIMVLSVFAVNISEYMVATGAGAGWLLVTEQVISYIIMAFSTIMTLYMITCGVSYKLKFFALIKNSFIFTLALLPLNVFFALFACIAFILLLLNVPMLTLIAVMLIIFFGVSLFMLIWTNYSQWVFDKYVNDRVPGAKRNRGIYKPNQQAESGEVVIEKSKYAGKNIKPITDYDVEIYELPTTFSRKDLQRLEETKEAMRKDSDKYSEEHSPSDEQKDSFGELLSEEQDGDAEKQDE